jgi:hypothetical protein
MTFEKFKQTLKNEKPPEDLNSILLGLWYAANDNWHEAHDIAQDIPGKDGSLLHAYLHRVEGDDWNAGYWYNRANESGFNGSLDDEWEMLARRFLDK